jgi:anti-anti-sigma factor
MDAQSSWGLRVLTTRDGPRSVVTLEGELDLASAAYLRSRLLPDSRHAGGAPVVLDVDAAGLTFVDVAGVGALIDIATAAGRAGAQLDRLIELLRLDVVLRPNGTSADRREG